MPKCADCRHYTITEEGEAYAGDGTIAYDCVKYESVISPEQDLHCDSFQVIDLEVHLIYFRESGKYASEGSYFTDKQHLFEIWDEAGVMQDEKRLPGLRPGHDPRHVFVDVPKHPHRHPRLILAGMDKQVKL